MPEAYSNSTHTRLLGSGGAGSAPEPRTGSAIDSACANIEHAVSVIRCITDSVTKVADSTMGTRPTEVAKDRIDHPPQTLQEYIHYLQDSVDRLDRQVARFF